MKAHDVMTWGVISVEADAPIMRAAQLMLENKIRGLPVLDAKGSLVGIVTEGDFFRRGEIGTQSQQPHWLDFLIDPGRVATEYVRARGRKVAEIMTRNPYSITGDMPLEEVVQLMETHRIKRLPVLDDHQIVGIVSRANIMRAFVKLARGTRAPGGTDDAIRQKILAECNKHPWAPKVDVVVRDGVVELQGAITDDRERRAFTVAAESVPGVKAVHDQLVHSAHLHPA